MKNKILITLFSVIVMLIFTACGEKKEDLTGKWERTTENEYSDSMEFFSDGSGLLCSYDNENLRSYDCTWIAENGRFKLTVDYGISGTKSFSGNYELGKDVLKLYYDNEPDEYVYYRK